MNKSETSVYLSPFFGKIMEAMYANMHVEKTNFYIVPAYDNM